MKRGAIKPNNKCVERQTAKLGRSEETVVSVRQ